MALISSIWLHFAEIIDFPILLHFCANCNWILIFLRFTICFRHFAKLIPRDLYPENGRRMFFLQNVSRAKRARVKTDLKYWTEMDLKCNIKVSKINQIVNLEIHHLLKTIFQIFIQLLKMAPKSFLQTVFSARIGARART